MDMWICRHLQCKGKIHNAHARTRTDQRNMGMSMKVERSTVDQVKNRLNMLKKKKEETERIEEFGVLCTFRIYGFSMMSAAVLLMWYGCQE